MLPATILTLGIGVLLPALCMAAVPWVQASTHPFGVFVAPAHSRDQRITRLKRGYSLGFCLAGLVLFAVAAIAGELASVISAASSLLLVVAAIVSYLLMRGRVRSYRVDDSWFFAPSSARAVAPIVQLPAGPISGWWLLLYPLMILLSVALVAAVYPLVPQEFAVHFDAAGVADGWEKKTPFTAGLAVYIQCILLVALLPMQLCIAHVRPTILDASRPVASLVTQGFYKRSLSAATLFFEVCALISFNFITLNFAQLMPIGAALSGMLMMLVFGLAVLLWCMFSVGQSGARLLEREAPISSAAAASSNDAERFWKGGLLYVNPDDPALVVPKLFGVGLTLNFGHRRAVVFTVLYLVVFAAVCALPPLLF